jgi:hypothetical protein
MGLNRMWLSLRAAWTGGTPKVKQTTQPKDIENGTTASKTTDQPLSTMSGIKKYEITEVRQLVVSLGSWCWRGSFSPAEVMLSLTTQHEMLSTWFFGKAT